MEFAAVIMNPVSINIQNDQSSIAAFEPLTFGVPLPQGELNDPSQLTLMDSKSAWPIQTVTTAQWPDGSVRWLLVQTQRPSDADPEQSDLVLALGQSKALVSSPIHAVENDKAWVIEGGSVRHILEKDNGRLLSCRNDLADDVNNWDLSFHHLDDQAKPIESCLESVVPEVTSGDVLVRFRLKGYWKCAKKPRFEYSLTLYALGGLVEVSYCLHNPNRARHPGGLWDLGDPGSYYFTGLQAQLACSTFNRARLTPEPGLPAIEIQAGKGLHLYQDSSGGDNWQSQNHIDKDGKVTTTFKGYRVSDGENIQSSGLRAQPCLELQAQSEKVCVAIPKFWQNFPSAIGVNESVGIIGLFPREYGKQYELQGGERKTQKFFIGLDSKSDTLGWVRQPTIPKINAIQYEKAEAFPWFKAEYESGSLDELIQIGLEGEQNFFAKREVIDEYGWRNFGDIFADHETLYQADGEAPLITHYNNQYDAIYGFARQFALTGDSRWYALMDDLAHHVTDIDIYHTDEDRAEYNHGLFWHTDHYLPAHTATHRTFTRHNDTSSTPGQTGGGPAAEHCYTTGLMVHYFLTGHTASRQAVVDLAEWMITLHDGAKGLLTRLWSIKKDDLNRLKQHLKGQSTSPYAYPFTRGTGNYITALVDAYEVTAEQRYLDKAEAVIRGTLHPQDDIQKRDLLNVELAWSYLVLLASLVRFLAAKNKAGQFDKGFQYTRAALLHYTEWMRHHERPFLTDPEQLEFANDTWVAQDIRKAVLMFKAAELNPTQSEQYQSTGQAWLNEVLNQLKHSSTSHFARIQIILLQNYGTHNVRLAYKPQAYAESSTEFGPAPQLNTLGLVSRLCLKGIKGLLEFRPRREKAWLDARLNRS